MQKILVLAAAIALVSSTAFAATSTLVVTANVTATCGITGGTLAFGALNPLVGGIVGALSLIHI